MSTEDNRAELADDELRSEFERVSSRATTAAMFFCVAVGAFGGALLFMVVGGLWFRVVILWAPGRRDHAMLFGAREVERDTRRALDRDQRSTTSERAMSRARLPSNRRVGNRRIAAPLIVLTRGDYERIVSRDLATTMVEILGNDVMRDRRMLISEIDATRAECAALRARIGELEARANDHAQSS